MTTIHHGDCIETMNAMPPESVDAIVTDPPYGLSFMQTKWDATPPGVQWAEACYRVLKPGGHIAAFGGTRTWHRLAVAIEDAGFEMRDSLAWLYGSGFPKSMNVGKAIDKAAGVQREVIGSKIGQPGYHLEPGGKAGEAYGSGINGHTADERLAASQITAPATPEAAQWDGWGTALKPAFEPIVLARKPLAEKTVARNVLAHGTGAINVDACRIATDEDTGRAQGSDIRGGNWVSSTRKSSYVSVGSPAGRWPANVLLDHHTAAWVDEQSGDRPSAGGAAFGVGGYGGTVGLNRDDRRELGYGDKGGASRFFYTTREDISCQIPDPVSTAGSLSFPPSASAGSAAGHAATSVSPGIVSEARSASTNDTGTGSRRSGASGTPPIGTTGSECSPESRHARPTPTPSHASNVELSEPTDITTTTTSPSISGGSAESATSSTTPASDLGVLPGGESGSRFMYSAKAPKRERPNVGGVQHPTVKPLAIMRWLIRLVTPPGGTVLDPFAGSGTTIEAALIEGFNPVGIEMETDYLPLIQHRIDRQAGTLTA